MANLNLTDSEIAEVQASTATGVADIDDKLTADIITSSLVVGSATDWAIHAASNALDLSRFTTERQRAFANAYTDDASLTTFINTALEQGQRSVFRRAVLYKTASNCVLYLRNLTSESGGAVSQSWSATELIEKQQWLDRQADSQIETLRSQYPDGVDYKEDLTFAGILSKLGVVRQPTTLVVPSGGADFDINGLTAGTPTATDEFAFYDTSVNALRKADIQAILDLAASQSFSISGLTTATPQVADEIPFNDTSDSNSNKKATITSIVGAWATANAARLVPSTGTTGHYLKKTATGSEWAEVSGGGGGSFDIEDLTTATPATGDFLAFHDASGNADRKATIQTVLNLASQASFSIDGLTAVTPALTDYLPIADASDSNANKKALISGVLGLIDESDWRVSGLTSATPVSSDMLVFSDESETNDPNRKATIATVLGLADDFDIDGLTAETTANNADTIAIYDASASAMRKMTRANFLSGVGSDFEITDLTTATPVTTDYLAFSDESASGDPNRKATISTILGLASQVSFDINALTAETTANNADTIAIYDASASAMRKMTRQNFLSGISGGGAAVTDLQLPNWLRNTSKDISTTVLRSANSNIFPSGITWDGSSVLVLDDVNDAVWGFTNGARDSSKDISQSVLRSAAGNIAPNGITWDGSSVLVVDVNNDAVWGFTNGARDTSKDISNTVLRSAANNIRPYGITWDGSSVLVLDDVNDAVWGFTNGARDTSKDISNTVLQSANSSIVPVGITWDGSSVLVVDSNADAVWGFTNGARDTSNDIAQSVLRSTVSNINPVGITWDGSSVLVADSITYAVWGFTNSIIQITLNLLSQVPFDISGLTAETSAADTDTIAIYDASASAMRKMTRSHFLSGVGFEITALTTATPITTDYLAFSDESASGNNRKATINSILQLANQAAFSINDLARFPFQRDTDKDISQSILRSADSNIIPAGITWGRFKRVGA